MFSLKSLTGMFIFLVAAFLLSHSQSATAQSTPDIRFILQTQAGLTAYAELPASVSLLHARQLLATVVTETDSFVYGEYVLASQPYRLNLAVGADGWIIAFHPTEYASQHLLDCAIPFNPDQIIGRPERAVQETAVALGYPDPVIGFYDGRFPQSPPRSPSTGCTSIELAINLQRLPSLWKISIWNGDMLFVRH